MGVVVLVLLQNLVTALFAVVSRPLSVRLPKAQFQATAVMFTSFYLLSLPVAFLTGPVLVGDLSNHLPVFLLVGLALGLQSVFHFWILRYMDAGVASLAGMLAVVSTIITATVVLGEGLTLQQLTGAAIILSAVGWVLATGVNKNQRRNWTCGLLLAGASAIFLAIGITGEKYLLGHMQPGSYIVWGWGLQLLVILMVSFLYNAQQYKQVLRRRNVKLLTALVVTRWLSALGFVTSLIVVNSASEVMVLSGLKVILAALLGMAILHERQFIRRKLIAAAAAALGTALMLW